MIKLILYILKNIFLLFFYTAEALFNDFTRPKIVFLAIIFSFFSYVFTFTKDHHYDFLIHYHDSIETLSFTAVILSTIFLAYQITFALSSYITKNKLNEENKSYEMAKFYGREIVSRLNPVTLFINKVNTVIPDYGKELNHSMPEIYRKKMTKFNLQEARSIFGKEIISSFAQKMAIGLPPKDLIEIMSEIKGISGLEISREWDSILIDATEEEKQKFYAFQRDIIYSFVADFFNDLEYFSMVFTSHLAVPKNVFDSLHQTYIEVVEQYYLYLSVRNNNEGHDYYTYIIKLYNTWIRDSTKRDIEYYRSELKSLGSKLIIYHVMIWCKKLKKRV